MKRLNIEIDDSLVAQAMKLANLKTMKEAVNEAIKFHLSVKQKSKQKRPKSAKHENQY